MIRSILPLNWFLIGLAAALGILLVGLEGGGIEERAVEPLFADFDGARASALEVSSARDGDASRVSLERTEVGEPWTVVQLFGAPASSLLVDGFLARIGAMSNLDLVSEDPSRLDEYELGERVATRVSVRGRIDVEEGEALDPLAEAPMIADFYVAAATDTAAFVRRVGDARVYRVAGLRVPPTEPFTWFDRRSLVPYENVQIATVTARGSALEGEVVLEQPADRFGSFRDAEGQSVPLERARDLLLRLRALFPTQVLERRDEAAFPGEGATLEIEVALRTGNVFRLAFGDTQGSDGAGVSVRRSVDTLVVTCDRQAVANLVAALRGFTD